ncbi:MAG: GDP-mannose 4,6-dehydratase, partial [Actinomycetota bacterium]|nr:GDP-mannose 4,6-dehydratase [Actinomycetota bacterium]
MLVTGATGFVGSHVAEAFVEAGHEVRCTVRSSSNLRWIGDLPAERVP